jgi:hypothetical protein
MKKGREEHTVEKEGEKGRIGCPHTRKRGSVGSWGGGRGSERFGRPRASKERQRVHRSAGSGGRASGLEGRGREGNGAVSGKSVSSQGLGKVEGARREEGEGRFESNRENTKDRRRGECTRGDPPNNWGGRTNAADRGRRRGTLSVTATVPATEASVG